MIRDLWIPGLRPKRAHSGMTILPARSDPMTAQTLKLTSRNAPPSPRCCCGRRMRAPVIVFAHGAGAGMSHPFMETGCGRPFATAASRRCATSSRTWRRAASGPMRRRSRMRRCGPRWPKPRGAVPELPLIAGGKSFGGRMTSQAQAIAPLPGVRGLAFLGFPLHPAGKPSTSGPRTFRHQGADAVPARHAR